MSGAELATLVPHLPAAVADSPGARRATGGWLMYLDSKSPHTRLAYLKDMEAWLQFCRAHRFKPLNVGRSELDAWIAEQRRESPEEGKKRAAPASINRRLSSVSSWYDYLLSEEEIHRNPVDSVQRVDNPAADESRTIGLSKEQVHALVRAARDDKHPQTNKPRNLAILTMLINNGLRCGEVMSLYDADLGTARGHRVARVAGKGGRVHTVPLAPSTCAALDFYLECRDPSPGPLFRTSTGKPVDHKSLYRLVRRLTRLAKLTDLLNRVSPHSLRHTAITAALDAKVSLRDVQDFARHADPKTTRMYDRNRHNLDRHATYKVAAYLSED